VEEAIALVGLKPLAHRLVDSLSGGERQRAWIAMLVAQDSRCLLLDEPPRRWILPIRSMSWRWCIV
jgi:iron complex transport system ATP-binding protein